MSISDQFNNNNSRIVELKLITLDGKNTIIINSNF